MEEKKKARLCVDFSEANSFEVINMLREAGFRVSTTPITGQIEPELCIGSESFYGLEEIKKYIERWKKK